MARFWIFILISLMFFSCNKDDDPEEEFIPLNFQSLVITNDTIESGETTTVKATATGYELIYLWSATAGDILGSGSEITYAASPCHVGENTITCKVEDGKNNSETKDVKIVVI